MNTTTEHPEATTTESSPRTGSPSGYRPEHAPLRRPFHDRMLAGVAEGLARYFGIDATIVRIAFGVLTVMGGAGISLYLAGLLLIPEEGSDQSIAGSLIESLQSRSQY
jgi:phage shock protein C